MNLHPAVVVNSGDTQQLQLSDQMAIPIPTREKTQLADGQKVIMGLRTEDIFIAHEKDKSDLNLSYSVDGSIKIVEPLGNETNLHMDLRGASLIARSEGRRLFVPGEKLPMTLDLTHLHIFDAGTEKSIY
jgi:multiple sugar transport system ATP-binding protein